MLPRFLALVGSDAEASKAMADAMKAAHAIGLAALVDRPRLLVLIDDPEAALCLEDEAGIILGPLFSRAAGAESVASLSGNTHRAIIASAGEVLLGSYWGGYVAILDETSSRQVHVVRPPLGELSCYVAKAGHLVVLASDVELLVEAGLFLPVIDWRAVAHHLLASELRRAETCLAGLTELPGGQRLTIDCSENRPGLEFSTLWTPWRFAHREAALGDRLAATCAVRETTIDCVGAWARGFEHVLVGVSGGLDSSIVAACLKHHGAPFSGLTLVTSDPSGDERAYARLVAADLGVPLAERLREVDRIDLSRSDAAHLPRPLARSFAQESVRIILEVAAETGADALFRGGGGDNVFCYLQSVSPIADRLLVEGVGRAAWRTAVDLCRLADASLPDALLRGARRAWARPPAYRWLAETGFLATDVAALADEAIAHPWLEAPLGALPGKAAHIALLVAIENHMGGLAPSDRVPALSPLLSQPLVELCLAIPSWLWCEGGNNRMIARKAFAADLPRKIIERRTKGTPDSFVIEIFEASRHQIRAMMNDGLLASHGLINAEAIDRIVADPRPVTGDAYARILKLVDVEAWLRSWSCRHAAQEDRGCQGPLR